VQQLCQAHGWQIGIESAPQGGTEVWLKYAAMG
jgi:signal transduction histidine kinase